MNIKKVDILAVGISVLDYDKSLKVIKQWVENDKRDYVCVAAVHLVMECQRDKNLLQGVNRAGLVTADGMPLVWVQKLWGEKTARRIYGPGLAEKVCQLASQENWSLYLLGGAKGQSQELKRVLEQKYPGVRIVGCSDTLRKKISPTDNQKINQSGAQVVLVGMGCPYQEKWMIENRQKIKSAVLIGVGAAFDIMTARVLPAPEWMQRFGLEWFFRLIQDPKRLWRRYLVLNSLFLIKMGGFLMRQNFRSKRGKINEAF